MLASTATLKATSALGLKTKQISLTGLGNQVQQLHPQLDPPWITQQAIVSRVKLQLSGHPLLRADVSKYRPEVYKSEKSKILKKIHKVALGKLLT